MGVQDRLDDRLSYAGQRAVGHLVAGQLDGTGHRAAGQVVGKVIEVSAGQHGILLALCRIRVPGRPRSRPLVVDGLAQWAVDGSEQAVDDLQQQTDAAAVPEQGGQAEPAPPAQRPAESQRLRAFQPDHLDAEQPLAQGLAGVGGGRNLVGEPQRGHRDAHGEQQRAGRVGQYRHALGAGVASRGPSPQLGPVRPELLPELDGEPCVRHRGQQQQGQGVHYPGHEPAADVRQRQAVRTRLRRPGVLVRQPERRRPEDGTTGTTGAGRVAGAVDLPRGTRGRLAWLNGGRQRRRRHYGLGRRRSGGRGGVGGNRRTDPALTVPVPLGRRVRGVLVPARRDLGHVSSLMTSVDGTLSWRHCC